MIIDKNGKLFGKISITDIVILVVIIAVSISLMIKFNETEEVIFFVPEDDIIITFYSESVDDNLIRALKVGDEARDNQSNTVFGKIREIVTGDSVVYGTNSDGQIIASSKENFSSVTIIVDGKGTGSEFGVIVNKIEYYLANTITEFTSEGITFSARIHDIRILN